MSDDTLSASDLRTRITALQKSRDAGVTRVRHGADEVQYASITEMNKILASLQAQLDALEGTSRRPKINYIGQVTKGFGVSQTSIDFGVEE